MDRAPATPDEINESLYGTSGKKKRGGHHKQRPVEERTASDGTICDSVEEKDYHETLILRKLVGEIRELKHHTKFKLEVNGVHIAWYESDWTYIDNATNTVHVLDYKGKRRSPKTGKLLPRRGRGFTTKVKLMKACFGLTVEIV